MKKKKKKKRKPDRRKGRRHVSPRVDVYCPPALLARLDAWIAKRPLRVPRGEVIRVAIERFLDAN